MIIQKPEDLGSAIKEARKRTGWTQRGLARYTGLSQGLLSSVENGKCEMSLSALLRIAPLLNMAIAVIDKHD